MAEFDQEIRRWILASEGGYVDHPKDPGGATNMGITRNTLAAWRGGAVSKADVRALTVDEAMRIYKANYWDRIWGERLPPGLAYAVLDYAIHSGVSRAVRDLQRTLGALYTGAIDGIIGALTICAVDKSDIKSLITRLCQRRMEYVRSLSTFETFGVGWTRRIVGNTDGFQTVDIGVIDRSIMRYRKLSNIPLPSLAEGRAPPETETALDSLKKPESWTMIGSGVATTAAAIADQPILQIGMVALLALGLFCFIQRQRGADPA
jgi:lysozyme family protein